MIERRRLLVMLGAGALSLGPARAQPAGRAGKIVRVGLLSSGTRKGEATRVFINAMREMGRVEDRNIVYDLAFAEGDEQRLAALAAELVARIPDLIWAAPGGSTLAVALASTRTIPIVFASEGGVVERGLVESLARPGGNVTGVLHIGAELGAKRLQLLKQTLPRISRIGVLARPSSNPSGISREFAIIEKAAATLGVAAIPAMAKDAGELDAAIASLVRNRAEAVLVVHTGLFYNERKRVIELAASRQLPVVGFRRQHADAGALLSYGALLSDQIRRSAQMADRILKGAKPADTPVEQPTKFELVVNARTARALGITIPQSILLQAQRVIE